MRSERCGEEVKFGKDNMSFLPTLEGYASLLKRRGIEEEGIKGMGLGGRRALRGGEGAVPVHLVPAEYIGGGRMKNKELFEKRLKRIFKGASKATVGGEGRYIKLWICGLRRFLKAIDNVVAGTGGGPKRYKEFGR